MKLDTLKKHLDKNRPMTEITLRMPEDVIDNLERLASKLGFSGYRPLIKTYESGAMDRNLNAPYLLMGRIYWIKWIKIKLGNGYRVRDYQQKCLNVNSERERE